MSIRPHNLSTFDPTQKPEPGVPINRDLADQCVGAWLYNEGAGRTIRNYASLGRDGTATAPSWGGDGMIFSSTNSSLVDVPEYPETKITKQITILARMSRTATATYCVALAKRSGTIAYQLTWLKGSGESPNNGIRMNADIAGTRSVNSALSYTETNTARSLAGRYDGSVLSVWYEGQQVGSLGIVGAITSISTSLRMGNDNAGSLLNGTLQYCYLFGRALSDGEITMTHYEPYWMFAPERRLTISVGSGLLARRRRVA